MTRSSTKDLLTPFEEPKRVLHSSRKLFKTLSLDYSSSPEFDLFSNYEDQFEKEVAEAVGEPTMKEYMTVTRINYESGNDKGMIKLKGRFLLELQNNALSGTHGEDTMEHIKNFLKIVDSLNIPNWDPNDLEFKNWLASKFRNYKTMDGYTKNDLWNYWKRGDDEEVKTNNELSNPRDDNLIEENEIAQIFRIDTDLFDFDTPLCQAFKEFNYLSQIDVDNKGIPWVNEKPWTGDRALSEPIDNIHHECNLLRFKSGTAKWPTYNWKEYGYCNTRDLHGFIRKGNSICYEDYEWYDMVEDGKLKEEALINKRILEE
ncbi:hypothetical protein Tco_1322972 [Tanacetum coccineum]